MDAPAILEQLQPLGGTVEVNEDKLRLTPGSLVPAGLAETMRQQKPSLLALLVDNKFDLPFPDDYGGLPRAQVEAVDLVNDQFGIQNSAHRKYTVLAWVRGYYQDRGGNYEELYETLKAEQCRLGRILDSNGDPYQETTMGQRKRLQRRLTILDVRDPYRATRLCDLCKFPSH